MRNPLSRVARSTEPKPTLGQRAAALKVTAARVMRREPVGPAARSDDRSAATAEADPHLVYREPIFAAHAEAGDCRPIDNVADPFSIESKACQHVAWRLWNLLDEVADLPAPRTLDGLGVLAVAQALYLEGTVCADTPEALRQAVLVRAALSVTGAALPPGFMGFGDEPEFREREQAALHRIGRIPAWAMKQARAECPAKPPEVPLSSPVANELRSGTSAAPNLSLVPLESLFALADLYDGGSRHFHIGAFWPKTGDQGPQSGKDLLIEEGDRLSSMFDAIVEEIAQREPADSNEADQQGEWLMRKAIAGGNWEKAAAIAAKTPAAMERAFARSEAASSAKAKRA
ncbi:hypothetical protein J2X36_004640 [Methylobacterium sp. BE186]|uniref:hypothetical protein n=1 Tax=Methylobacterium sp. BE186 TaxID=2817715 RepID=UPI002863F460|nr:hypothetical protein [Methylobacterium sp. BE186]MDR7039862.1 hypothetical protein [Methylobacterium sp. BE186]